MNAQAKTRRWWTALILLLILIFALRAWELPHVPPGLTHDEASNGHDSAAILEGDHRIYFPVGYGHEPLYNYSVAATTAFLGQGIFTLRITTLLWGLLQSILIIALARRWWGRTAALAVAAAYAANFWSLMLARVGLRAPVLPALLAASVLAYDHAIHPAGHRGNPPSPGSSPRTPAIAYAAAGLFLGASLYTYMASRGMPLLYIVFLIALACLNRRRFQAVWRGTIAVLLIAAIVSAPLFIYLHRHPHLEQRIGQLGVAITAFTHGDVRPLLNNIHANMPLLLTKGDPQWLYNIAGRPGLEPLLALFFIIGLLFAALHLRTARQGPDERILLATIWLVGGLAPAILVAIDYNLLHAIAAMPPVMLFIGAGFAWVADPKQPSAPGKQSPRLQRHIRLIALIIGIVGFALTTTRTAHAYFVTWAENRNVRVAYHHHVVALGRHLEAHHALDRPTVITSLYPGRYHDPYTMEVTLGRQAPSLRWADGRTALFIPVTETQLFVEAQTQPAEPIWSRIEPDLTLDTTLTFREDDIPSSIRGYTWETSATWQRLKAQAEQKVSIGSGDPPPGEGNMAIEGPVRFGDTVTLVGYIWSPTSDNPHAPLQLLTLWEVNATTPHDLTVFAHLLDANGELIAQDDRLDAPSWQWQPGDRWLQRHEFSPPTDLAADLRAGMGFIILGLYDSATGDRLSVTHDLPLGPPGATRVVISLENLEP